MEMILWIAMFSVVVVVALLVKTSRQRHGRDTPEPGKPTAIYRGKHITVLPSANRQLWKYRISDPLGMAEPVDSEWYADPETACAEAISRVAARGGNLTGHRRD